MKVCSVSLFIFVASYCEIWFLYIIYYFWDNTFYGMVQGMGIGVFACDSFHSIDA